MFASTGKRPLKRQMAARSSDRNLVGYSQKPIITLGWGRWTAGAAALGWPVRKTSCLDHMDRIIIGFRRMVERRCVLPERKHRSKQLRRSLVAGLLIVLAVALFVGLTYGARYGYRLMQSRWLKSASGKMYTPGGAVKKTIKEFKE